jgi:hypothetical protein
MDARKAGAIPRWMNVVGSVSAEGREWMRYHAGIRRMFDRDPSFLSFFGQEPDVLPKFHEDRVFQTLGFVRKWLPEGTMQHGPNAYLKEPEGETAILAVAAVTEFSRSGPATPAIRFGIGSISKTMAQRFRGTLN